MKNQLKRRFIILLASCFLVIGISAVLNRASFDPNFSVLDAISGATKRSQRHLSKQEKVASWSYSVDDLALPDEAIYAEETIKAQSDSYVLLKKVDFPKDTLVILSDKDNNDYMRAVQQVTEYYENLGYTVKIREYSETMMLSLAHAGHFDLFLLRKEASV